MSKPDNKVFEERREIFLNKLDGKAAIIPGANLVTHHADCEYPVSYTHLTLPTTIAV